MSEVNKLKDALDGSMWDLEKPMQFKGYNQAVDVRQDQLKEQMKTPVETLALLINMQMLNDKILVEPQISTWRTLGGLEIRLDGKANVAHTVDMAIILQRVLAVSKEANEKFGLKAGDYVLLGPENCVGYTLGGVQVIETRFYNVTAVVKDVDIHKRIIKWLNNNSDMLFDNEAEMRECTDAAEGTTARTLSLSDGFFVYKNGQWVKRESGIEGSKKEVADASKKIKRRKKPIKR